MLDAIALTLFDSRCQAVCDEMGLVLRRTAVSPNIKDRLDYSCAVFDASGHQVAQAAHIPVHLGSMAFAMHSIVDAVDWQDGDVLAVNDPFEGGTHLPDVTVVVPVFVAGACVAFVADRAHHADIGAAQPGSMPISRSLAEEGVLIPPTLLIRGGVVTQAARAIFAELLGHPVDDPEHEPRLADFHAQQSAARLGAARVAALVERMGVDGFRAAVAELDARAERLARAAIAAIPDGEYRFRDWLDDDGVGGKDIPVVVCVTVRVDTVRVDFTGTAAQVAGNLNCPMPVTAAGVFFVFRCLMPRETPATAGVFRAIDIIAPEGSLVNARRGAAVAAGNVETSMRIVDVVCGALALALALPDRIPAASQGTMNNVAMGARAQGATPRWDYYETLGGGGGAGADGPGTSAIHAHMTNTLNTPVESLEAHYPLRMVRYAIRRGSGGTGRHAGGDGLVRTFEFLAPAQVTLIGERRRRGAWGLDGGGDGAPGRATLNGAELPGKVALQVAAGDVLEIATPGGGGWGRD